MIVSVSDIATITQIAGGGWTPRSISGCKLWLRADTLVADGLGDGDAVTTWRDESGQGNDITQANAAKRPILKLGIVNNKPVVRFDGTDDVLKSAGFGPYSEPNTIIVVGKADNADTNSREIVCGSLVGYHHIIYTNSGKWHLYNGINLDSGDTDDANWHIFFAEFNGASSFLRLDGSQIASGDAGTAASDGMTVGNSYLENHDWDGDVAEVIMYNSGLGSADRDRAESYLSKKYGISI